VRLCPWADVVYGCDGPWWRARNGLPEYSGVKLAHDTGVCAEFPDVHKIEVVDEDRLLFEEPGRVGAGGNSGFQAVNLAAQFGVDRILLIGFDMHTGAGLHWYGRNAWRMARNPGPVNLMRWRDAFVSQAPVLLRRGIEVINASPDSALTCFEHRSIDAALKAWNL
jgi:hypothetical protein